MTEPDVDSALFRQLLGRFATGVTIVTTRAADDTPIGMTASSLASISLIPPLVSVAIDHEATIHAAVVGAPEFAVNILEAKQEALSRRFAGNAAVRFDGVGYRVGERGLVLLDGALAHIECARHAVVEAGDHTIVIGRVIGGSTSDGRPLLYYRGGYAALG